MGVKNPSKCPEVIKLMADIKLNSYKPGVPFMGHRQTVNSPRCEPQNAASHLGLFFLHSEISSKNEIKKINITSNIPKNESGLTQLLTIGEAIHQIWVNQLQMFQNVQRIICTFRVSEKLIYGIKSFIKKINYM